MSFIPHVTSLSKNYLSVINHPAVKEGIKNSVGSMTFAFGFFGIYDFYQIAKDRKISIEKFSNSSKWVQTLHKVIIICAKISLILSASLSRPGYFIISALLGYAFSKEQLVYVFGPNTLFAINPWHPRHIASLVAVILTIPTVMESLSKGIMCHSKRIRHYSSTRKSGSWLTDNKIRLMTLFNAITSRPILHLENRFANFLLRT